MKSLVLAIAISLCFANTYAQTDKRLSGIEKQFNSVLESTKTPGFAVAIVEGDQLIYAKGFGYRDLENKVPADANTLYAIGSSTKAFTAALLGLLREDKKLDFNDSPKRYISELDFYNAEMNATINIKDLMRHSTGLPRHDAAWYFFPSHDKDSLIARIKHQEPFAGVRERWYYNNFMYLVQGVIAERITGKSWEENIEEAFFKPLGMANSTTNLEGMLSAKNKAFGYRLNDDRETIKVDYYDIAGMSPAGSINSSVNDMSNWLMTWINDGKFKDAQILPANYIDEATSSQMVVAAGTPTKDLPDVHFANYGYGWMVHSYKGHYMVEHGGNIDGFSANVAIYPTDSLGIVVLTNQNGSAVPQLVRDIAADYMLKTEKTDWAKKYKDELKKGLEAQANAKANTESSKVNNTRPSHVKQDYTGTYEHKGYGTFEIIVENDSLFTQFRKERVYLHHHHYDTFELLDYIDSKVDTASIGNSVKMTFRTSESGDIDGASSTIEPTLDPIYFKRSPNTIDVDAKSLERYVGKYNLAGTEIKAYIKDGNVLYVFVPGQPEYELIPTALHKFSFKILDGFKVEFIEAEDGLITDVKFIQPNGTFVAKKNLND